MHETRPAKITSPIVTLGGAQVKTIPIALIVGAVGIGLALVLSGFSMTRFLHIYLVNYAFVLTMCIGCLFFVTISHLTRAGWNVTVRRIAELYAMCLLPLAILFLPILIPVLLGYDDLYVWNAAGWSTHNAELYNGLTVEQLPPLEQLKYQFLNPYFFAGRWVVYFLIWGTMGWYFLSRSLKQDQLGDKNLTAKMQAFSAPAMIVFAASLVFSSFDLLMSLEPLWFSTMFPVYFFAGSILSALALITLTALWLQRSGRVTDEITIEHYHDMGKLMHGFIVFWGYIAFSQFMLIWYANIPEETFWYEYRINQDGWRSLSLLLLVGHLFVPFLAMMGRTVRRNKAFLGGATIYLLVMHWIDMYWIIMPQCYAKDGHTFTLGGGGIFIDLACTVGMIGFFIAIFCLVTRDKPLIALQDPRLGEALNHEVH
jgi:hypothetical protein